MKKKLTVSKWGLVFFALASTTFLNANPSNPTVVSGDVSFSTPVSGTLQVSSNDTRSIVDWESFSIGTSETTNFVLPSSSSAILNRVTVIDAGNVSNIAGTLTSNGQVYLINPNGILIGGDAVINTSAFLASTLDTDNQDFLNENDLTFLGNNDANIFLVNQGTISAGSGDIILLSYQIQNTGTTTSSEGTTAMGAGVEILLQPNSSDNRIVIVPQTLKKRTARGLSNLRVDPLGVEDSSLLNALKVELAADGNFYEHAIKHEGTIVATGLIGQDCSVKFTGVDGSTIANGSITASNNGAVGGTIAILGVDVEIGNSCTLTASGNNGGGSIYVGGGWGGADPSLMNATTMLFRENAVATVDAIVEGEAGTAVVWADDTATFNGTIYARGGAMSGNGGEVEVSGVETTTFNGVVDVTAANGDDGHLTMDPWRLRFRCKGPGKVPHKITLVTPRCRD